MIKLRGREHSTLTETAAAVVYELKGIPGIKMIAPGEIRTNKKIPVAGTYLLPTLEAAGFSRSFCKM